VETTSEGPRELDRFELVLLKRPASSPTMPDDEIDRLQELHLAHLTHQAALGAIRVAGPFDGQSDQSLRGMALYQTGSLDQTRSIATSDPAVVAGRLEVDVMYFYCPKGQL
jgi:uncharacterized protein YciI